MEGQAATVFTLLSARLTVSPPDRRPRECESRKSTAQLKTCYHASRERDREKQERGQCKDRERGERAVRVSQLSLAAGPARPRPHTGRLPTTCLFDQEDGHRRESAHVRLTYVQAQITRCKCEQTAPGPQGVRHSERCLEPLSLQTNPYLTDSKLTHAHTYARTMTPP